jgi:hypothetical protein
LNNPLKYTDPTGYLSWSGLLRNIAIGVAVVAAFTVVVVAVFVGPEILVNPVVLTLAKNTPNLITAAGAIGGIIDKYVDQSSCGDPSIPSWQAMPTENVLSGTGSSGQIAATGNGVATSVSAGVISAVPTGNVLSGTSPSGQTFATDNSVATPVSVGVINAVPTGNVLSGTSPSGQICFTDNSVTSQIMLGSISPIQAAFSYDPNSTDGW